MPDELTAKPEKVRMTAGEFAESFYKNLSDPDPKYAPQRKLFNALRKDHPGGLKDTELVDVFREKNPSFSDRYDIYDPGAKPPAVSGTGTAPERGPIGKAWDFATTPIPQQIFGKDASLRTWEEGRQKQFAKQASDSGDPLSATERFAGGVATEAAGFADDMTSPLALATLGLSPRLKALFGAGKAAGKLAKIGEKGSELVRRGFGAVQAANTAGSAVDFAQDPSAEKLAKLAVTGAVTGSVLKPEIAGAGRAAASVARAVPRVPGAVKAGAEGFMRGSGLSKPGQPPAPSVPYDPAAARATPVGETKQIAAGSQPPAPRQLAAGPPVPEVTTIPIDTLRTATGLPQEELAILSRMSAADLQARRNILHNTLSSETSALPDVPSQSAGGKSKGQGKSAAENMRVRNNAQNQMKAIDLLLEDKAKAAGATQGKKPIVTPPGEQPPPPLTQEERFQEPTGGQKAIAPPAPARIEGGQSGWAADPRAQGTMNAVEANTLAQKYSVDPGDLVEASRLSNEQMVEGINFMHARRAKISAGDPDNPSVDELTKHINAFTDLLMSRIQPPKPRGAPNPKR